MERRGTPTLHITADNIPQAHYRAMKAVMEHGYKVRTMYDRKDGNGKYIDPPGFDATVMIEVIDPLSQPRYPAASYCEVGAYIGEIFGIKDHLVVPISILRRMIDEMPLSDEERNLAHEWPYTYHGRFINHPEMTGDDFFNQLTVAINAVAQTPFTRRAMMTTAVPNLDPMLTEDIPCLREIQLRCVEEDDIWYLNPSTFWRSRDLFKAWSDNTVALTCWLQWIAMEISKKTEREVRLGSYKDISLSLHVYGQDLERAKPLVDMGEETYIARSMASESAVPLRVISDLEKLLTDSETTQWQFPSAAFSTIHSLITDFQSGKLV